MTEKPVKFFLSKSSAGKDFSVWRLPSVPPRLIKALGWEEGQPMEMSLTSDGIDIRKLKTKETK